MKALADPRSAEGRQEIQAIKASICVLHEALAKSNSRRSGTASWWLNMLLRSKC